MVAIVASNGLGLLGSALSANGQSALGRSDEQHYVNLATGNLVIQRQDELVVGHGPGLSTLRTYNSQGQFSDDNGDNWRIGFAQKLHKLTGQVNTAGSTITRVCGDGAELIYTYDSTQGSYINTDGSGSYDSLAFLPSSTNPRWTWRDGDSRNSETYEWNGTSGRLTKLRDADGHGLDYIYDASLRLISVRSVVASATIRGITHLEYAGSQLARLRTELYDGPSVQQTTRVSYTYDAQNRLASVIVDLTPEDNSTADGRTFVTSYAYDSVSGNVASITKTDGTQVSFAYTQVAGKYRVRQITEHLTGSSSRTTGFSYDTANGKTTVTDPLGNATVYTYDAQGQLTNILGPSVGGVQQSVSYQYNANGDLMAQTDARGLTVTYEYDTNGNLTLQRDAAGTTVLRTYGSKNQLLTETVYLTADPDGAGSAQPSQPVTSRYVYDTSGRLRFVVSPEGRVTEHRYSAITMARGDRITTVSYAASLYTFAASDEASLTSWAASAAVDKTKIIREDYAYDFRGQVKSVTRYAKTDASGVGISDGTQATTEYVYDAAGQLLKTIAPKGVASTGTPTDFVTTYTYDGLGRLLTTTDSVNRVTQTHYDDTGNKTTVTLANGLATTSSYNKAGELISVLHADGATALGETKYWYDAEGKLRMTQDPTGVKHYKLYDEADRLVADIDGDGSLVEYLYNANNQIVHTIRYATALSAAQLASLVDASGHPTNITLSSVRPAANTGADRHSWSFYDNANRLVKTVDALGYVTQQFYDGAGRITDLVRYATDVSVASINGATQWSDTAVTPAASAQDRRTRQFYDADGKAVATLDAGGYLTENQYDAAGRLIHTIGYATQAPSSHWSTGTLAQLRPSADAAQDTHTWMLYDGRGNLTATVDAEGYLTEYQYDANGNKTSHTRYTHKALIAPEAITADTALAALKPATDAQDQTTSWTYTDLNQLATLTDYQGTVTQFAYDNVGNLIRTDKALAMDARAGQVRYDIQGRVLAELTGEGSAALAALGANASATQTDAVWNSYGVHHAYDAAGRRISTTDANGNKTLFYYNVDGQLVYTVNALGEVKENRYNTLGDLTQTVQYGTRLASSSYANWTGGLANDAVCAVVTALASGLVDSTQSFSYDHRGQLLSVIDNANSSTTFSYTAFGEKLSGTTVIGAGQSVHTQYAYDKRGLLQKTRLNALDASFVDLFQNYDAFGRLTSTTDGNGHVRTTTYDRLGRVTQTLDPLNVVRGTTYDAFSRVLTQTDGLGHATRYAYDKLARTLTITTPEGIQTVTTYDRHGQTISVRDAQGNTTAYAYDKNGNLRTTTVDSGRLDIVTESKYDQADRLIETIDANGSVTQFQYDAANRLLKRIVDPSGLNLATTYSYDAKGQAISVVDANGTLTTTSYDLKGQVVEVAVDPTGLNLRTTYTYDGRGKKLTVTEGAGSSNPKSTEYTYDKLGRLTKEQVGAAALGIVTSYAYDNNDNLIQKTDAGNNLTRYVYDSSNRLTLTIDALGGVTEQSYDKENRVVATKRYAKLINLGALPAASAMGYTEGQIRPLIVTDAADQVIRSAYDKDGRLTHSVDAAGYVTERTLDQNGNVVQLIEYANAVTASWTTHSELKSLVQLDAVGDRRSYNIYDAANRAIYSIDALRYVTEKHYDKSGNVSKTVRRATAITVPATVSQGTIVPAIQTNAKDRTDHFAYDKAGRLRFHVDAEGYVTAATYDKVGRERFSTRYADRIAIPASVTEASINGLLPATLPATAAQTETRYDAAGRKTDLIDAEGNNTRYSYNAAGLLSDITRGFGTADASVTHYDYDAASRLVREHVAYGTASASVTEYTLNALGQRIAILDPRAYALMYSDSAWAQQSRQENGQPAAAASLTSAQRNAWRAQLTTVQKFDALGRLYEVVDALQGKTTTQYDAFGNVTRSTDARNYSTYYFFDELNRVTQTVDAEHYLTTRSYDAFGNQTSVTRHANKVQGTLGAAVQLLPGGAAAPASAYLYKDALKDAETVESFDQLDRRTSGHDAEGHVESVTLNAFGQADAATNKLGGTAVFTYDKLGRMLTETLPVQSKNAHSVLVNVVHRYEYDARGNRTKSIEAEGLPESRTTVYAFDKLNRQTTKTGTAYTAYDATSDTTSSVTPTETQQFDRRGNLIETNANGARTLTWYDAADRKIAQLNAEGTLTTWTYDAKGLVVSETVHAAKVALPATPGGNPPAAPTTQTTDNRVTDFQYDALGRLGTRTIRNVEYGITVSGSYLFGKASATTSQTTDAVGNVVQSTDANGGVTLYYYDGLGRKTLQVDPGKYLTSWEHDANGGVTKEVRFATRLTTITPAPQNDTGASSAQRNVASLVLAVGTNAEDRITIFSLDRLGRVTEKRVKNVTSDYVDGNGLRSTRLTDAITQYGYDGLGNVRSSRERVALLADGVSEVWETTDYTYDRVGREITKQSPSFIDYQGDLVRPTTDTEYDGLGNLKRLIQRGKDNFSETDDRITQMQYDANSKLVRQIDANGAHTTFAYDAQGAISKTIALDVKDADGHLRNVEKRRQNDLLGRTIVETDVGTNEVRKTEYNAFGEVSRKGVGDGWQEFAYYNALGKVWKTNSGDGVTKLTVHDRNGNATMSIQSAGADLAGFSLSAAMADNSGLMLKTISVYDNRNLLTETIQPKIENQLTSGSLQAVFSTERAEQYPPGTVIASVSTSEASGTAIASSGAVVKAFGAPLRYRYNIRDRLNMHLTVTLPDLSAYGPGTVVLHAQALGSQMSVQYPYITSMWVGDSPTAGAELTVNLWDNNRQQWSWFDQRPNERWAGFTLYFESANYGRITIKPMEHQQIWHSGLPWEVQTEQYYDDVAYQTVSYPVGAYTHAVGVAQTPKIIVRDLPATTTQVLALFRGADGQSWSTPQSLAQWKNDAETPKGYELGTAGWPEGSRQYQYIALDQHGNVLSRYHGTINISNGIPSVSQHALETLTTGNATPMLIAGHHGVAFVNLGSGITDARMKFRAPGGAWQTVGMHYIAPGIWGWPAAAYASAGFELEIQTRTGSQGWESATRRKATLQGTPGNFSTTPLKLIHLAPQWVDFYPGGGATALSVQYRVPNGTWSALVPVAAIGGGLFRWDASGLVPDRSVAYNYEYRYTASGPGGVVSSASGTMSLGAGGDGVARASTPDYHPTQVVFQPTREAARMQLRLNVQGSLHTATDTVVTLYKDGAGRYVFDANSILAGTTHAVLSFEYILQDAAGNTIYDEAGKAVKVPGTLTIGNVPTTVVDPQTGTGLQWLMNLSNVSATLRRTQSHNAFGEVDQENDGRGNYTDFKYSTLGKLIEKKDPQISVTAENGAQSNVRPTTYYGYDLAGRLNTSTDANGNLSRRSVLAGSSGQNQNAPAEREFFADGGVKKYAFDVFGDARRITNEVDILTEQDFDKLSQLIEVRRQNRAAGSASANTVALRDIYQYDGLGNRIQHTNALGYVEKTFYDNLARVTRYVSAENRQTQYVYTYVPAGVAAAIVGAGGANIGGYKKQTINSDGRSTYDHIEYFGRTTYHYDMGGRHSTYYYDKAGRLIRQTSTIDGVNLLQDIQYSHYANGYVREIRDDGAHDADSRRNLSRFAYDDAGNRVQEMYAELDLAGTVANAYQISDIEYDALNRVSRILDPKYELRYEYDAVGNRRRVWSYYQDGVGGKLDLQDYWYKYDAMNRFTVTKGTLVGARGSGSIALGAEGIEIGYDKAGQRASAYTGATGTLETYHYTTDGFLEEVRLNNGSRTVRIADALGRTTTYQEFNTANALNYWKTTVYDKDNRTLTDSSRKASDADTSVTQYYYYTDTSDTADSQSGGGALARAVTTTGSTASTSRYRYVYWDSARQSEIRSSQSGLPGEGVSTIKYNVNGYESRVIDSGSLGRNLRYTTNAKGQIMLRTDLGGNTFKIHNYYYLDGRRIGDVNNDPASNTRKSYAEVLAQRDRTVDKKAEYKGFVPAGFADFDQNYEPINDTYPGATSSNYTARGGETLRNVARSLWGDEAMWYLIADANGLSGATQLVAGQVLVIPNKVTNIHNTATTFRPYNAGEAIGDVNPSLPEPPPPPTPKKGGCGGVGMIIMVIVAIVAAYFIGPLAFKLLSTFGPLVATVGAGAIAAAAGSVASQGVGIAIGAQDKFSWKAVGQAALGGAVTAGITLGMTGAPPAGLTGSTASAAQGATAASAATSINWSAVGQAALHGAASSATTQLLQGKFSWKNVAASALSSGAGNAMGQSFNIANTDAAGNVVRSGASLFTERVVTGYAAGAVSQLVATGRADSRSLFLNSLGSAIGDSFAAYIGDPRRRFVEEQDKRPATGAAGGNTFLSRGQENRLLSGETMSDFDTYTGSMEGLTASAADGLRKHRPQVSQGAVDRLVIGEDAQANREALLKTKAFEAQNPGASYEEKQAFYKRVLDSFRSSRSHDLSNWNDYGNAERPFTPVPMTAAQTAAEIAWLTSSSNGVVLEGGVRTPGTLDLTGRALLNLGALAPTSAHYDAAIKKLYSGGDSLGAFRFLAENTQVGKLVAASMDYDYGAPRGSAGGPVLGARHILEPTRRTQESSKPVEFSEPIREQSVGATNRAGSGTSLFKLGSAFEDKAVSAATGQAFEQGQAVRRLSVRAFDDNGNLLPGRTVLDVSGTRVDDGAFGALEIKLSEKAPYTTRQTEHFPYLEKNGGVVVGNNGRVIGLRPGDVLPPFKPNRINGPELPAPGDWWKPQ